MLSHEVPEDRTAVEDPAESDIGKRVDRPLPETEYRLLDAVDEWYNWKAPKVDGIGRLCRRIVAGDWYKLLKKHLSVGNGKIAANTWVWNICSAHDCPHLETDRCQVTKDGSTKCYAYHNEVLYSHSKDSPGGSLHSRRRQEVIWDLLDAQTFADTLKAINSNKKDPSQIQALRMDESGDFRNEQDLLKFNHIAKELADVDITCYVYSASSNLNWSVIDEKHFALLGSNERMAHVADALFTAKPEGELPDTAVLCPAEAYGRDHSKCGECRLCPDADEHEIDTIYVPIH